MNSVLLAAPEVLTTSRVLALMAPPSPDGTAASSGRYSGTGEGACLPRWPTPPPVAAAARPPLLLWSAAAAAVEVPAADPCAARRCCAVPAGGTLEGTADATATAEVPVGLAVDALDLSKASALDFSRRS